MWTEAGHGAKHPTVYWMAPYNLNYSEKDVNSAQFENLLSRDLEYIKASEGPTYHF